MTDKPKCPQAIIQGHYNDVFLRQTRAVVKKHVFIDPRLTSRTPDIRPAMNKDDDRKRVSTNLFKDIQVKTIPLPVNFPSK